MKGLYTYPMVFGFQSSFLFFIRKTCRSNYSYCRIRSSLCSFSFYPVLWSILSQCHRFGTELYSFRSLSVRLCFCWRSLSCCWFLSLEILSCRLFIRISFDSSINSSFILLLFSFYWKLPYCWLIID